MEIIDKIGIPSVVEFIQAQLEPFDTTKLEWIRLNPLGKRGGAARYSGYCRFPKRLKKHSRQFKHQYQISCSVNTKRVWPASLEIPVGTWQNDAHLYSYGYIYHTEMFASVREPAAFVAGHELYHFLRHSRQIDGRNTEPSANRYGLEWLEAWRQAAEPLQETILITQM